jgi:hypothetical protein
MADIEVNCGNCGNAFAVAEELAGLIATCPHCGRQISVPLPHDRRSGAPRLQVRRDAGITGGRKCPSCGAAMSDEAVLCVQCGWGVPPAAAPSRIAASLLAVAGVIIITGLVWSLLQRAYRGDRSESAPVPGSVATNPPVAAATLPVASNVVAGVDTNAPPPGATGEVSAASTAADEDALARAKREADYRVVLKKQMDTKYPMHGRGGNVAVRRTNGQVHRGVLTDLRKDVVVLVLPGGLVVEIPYEALDVPSRLCCDRAFRDHYTDALVKRHGRSAARP